VVELYDTVNIIEVLNVHKKLFSEECVTGSNKMNLALHVSARKFCSIFKEIWSFSTDFNKRLQYQISRKSVQWEPRWYMRTDGQTNGRIWRS